MDVTSIDERRMYAAGDFVQIANHSTLHDLNTTTILQVIREEGPVSRTHIAARTGLAQSTVSVISGELQHRSVIRECGHATSTGGRRPVLLELNPEGGYFITANLGNGSLTVGVLNLALTLVYHASLQRGPQVGQSVYEQLVTGLTEAQTWCNHQGHKVLGIGIATPGLVDPQTGRVVEADFLKWRDFDLKQRLAARFGCLVVLENDTNAAAYGEFQFGSERNKSTHNLMYLTVGKGIGAGLIFGNKLYNGAFGMAGEIGHVTVDPEGVYCTCGKRGCLEAYAAIPAMLGAYDSLSGPLPEDASDTWLLQRADSGDVQAASILVEAGRRIGMAIGNQANVLNIECVLVDGPFSRHQTFFTAIVEGIEATVIPALAEALEVRTATLGAQAGLIGIASLCLEQLLLTP